MLFIENSHSMSDYISLLRQTPYITIDYNQLLYAITDSYSQAFDQEMLCKLYMSINSEGLYNSTNKEILISYLLSKGVEEQSFIIKGRKDLSIDMKKVIEPLYQRGIHKDVLGPYMKYRSYISYYNFLKKLLKSQDALPATRNDTNVIINYPFTVEERENLRAYYSNLSVISIPKLYSNIITVPDTNFFLAWGDYPQADWRLAYSLFIRDETNAKVMDMYEDSYEGIAALIEGDNFDKDTFMAHRNEYKVNTLKTFYGSSSNDAIVKKLHDFFMSCKKYKKYYNDLNLLYSFKLPICCKSYFGFEQLLPEQKSANDFISKGLNTPIQTMTSHLVIETVFGILDKFFSLGYSNTDIQVYFVRHDEPIFLVHKSILKDAWVFGDCSQIHIDGFSPFKLDFHFGYNYTEEDETLTNIISKCCNDNEIKYSHYNKGFLKNYYPLPNLSYGFCDVVIEDKGVFAGIVINDQIERTYRVDSKIYKTALKEALYKFLCEFPNINYLFLNQPFTDCLLRIKDTIIKLNYSDNASNITYINKMIGNFIYD